jgi:hypothetical protein
LRALSLSRLLISRSLRARGFGVDSPCSSFCCERAEEAEGALATAAEERLFSPFPRPSPPLLPLLDLTREARLR